LPFTGPAEPGMFKSTIDYKKSEFVLIIKICFNTFVVFVKNASHTCLKSTERALAPCMCCCMPRGIR
jgi:hypothetical protein